MNLREQDVKFISCSLSSNKKTVTSTINMIKKIYDIINSELYNKCTDMYNPCPALLALQYTDIIIKIYKKMLPLQNHTPLAKGPN